jgi:hypothetical protein
MKLYFFFALIDLIILLVYPIAYIVHRAQKLIGAKPGQKNNPNKTY